MEEASYEIQLESLIFEMNATKRRFERVIEGLKDSDFDIARVRELTSFLTSHACEMTRLSLMKRGMHECAPPTYSEG